MNYADNLKKKHQKDSKRSQWRDIITPTLYTIKKHRVECLLHLAILLCLHSRYSSILSVFFA